MASGPLQPYDPRANWHLLGSAVSTGSQDITLIAWILQSHPEQVLPSQGQLFRQIRDLKEKYILFNARNAGKPIEAHAELDELIPMYQSSGHEIFREFGDLLEKYKDYIINSFIMVEKHGYGNVYDSRLSNGPMESINR